MYKPSGLTMSKFWAPPKTLEKHVGWKARVTRAAGAQGMSTGAPAGQMQKVLWDGSEKRWKD